MEEDFTSVSIDMKKRKGDSKELSFRLCCVVLRGEFGDLTNENRIF
jgi:hypothetical protein